MVRRTAPIRRAAALVALALAAPLGAVTVAVTTASPAAAAPLHTLVNPTFEGTTGWSESTGPGTLASAPGRRGTGVRLTHSSTSRAPVILNDTRNTVSRTVVGASYTATAWVRATVPTPVGIRLQEWASAKKGEAASTATLGTSWTLIGVNYVATTSGASLDLNVFAPSLPAGAALDVDDVTFRSRAPAWVDDFSGTALDPGAWTALNTSTFGDGNLELACLTSRSSNLAVDGGALALTARREASPLACGSADTRFPGGRDYSSAFIQTKGKKAFTYGRFAMRAKLPTAQGVSKGLWPGFWMRPVDGGVGELDITEAIGSGGTGTPSTVEATRVHQSIHYDYVPTHPMQKAVATFPTGSTPSNGLHTYAVEWDPGQIQWFVDGRLTQTRTTSTTPWLATAFSRPMYLRLNLAVGGRWPGSPDDATAFPASYLIDAVSVHGPAIA
ncbi:MAG: family 16 glycosylhydrolase [Kineosporiaceae bacterium]